jgi:hypothetical protein
MNGEYKLDNLYGTTVVLLFELLGIEHVFAILEVGQLF